MAPSRQDHRRRMFGCLVAI